MKHFHPLLAIASLLALGCAGGPPYHVTRRPVARGATGPGTTITGFLYTPTAPFLRDESPHVDLPHSTIADDVYISSLDRDQVCFSALVRTSAGEDRPLAAWRVHVNGRLEAFQEVETKMIDYPVEYTRTVASAKLETPLTTAEASITEPKKGYYRIVERRGELCSVRPAGETVKLLMEVPWVSGDFSGEVFEWLLR